MVKNEPMTEDQEVEFHKTAQRNAIGGWIGCSGPECWALISSISADNTGRKVQSAR